MEHQQAELPVVEEAEGSLFGMERDGRHGAKSHPRGGLADLGEHRHRLTAECSEIDAGGGVRGAEDTVPVGENAGLQTGKLSRLGNHSLERQLLLGHEEGLQRRGIGQPILRIELPERLHGQCLGARIGSSSGRDGRHHLHLFDSPFIDVCLFNGYLFDGHLPDGFDCGDLFLSAAENR